MASYRLPDWLGGHAVQILNEEAGSVRLTIDSPDSAGDCWLPKRWLVEVRPPIPYEPEPGPWLIGDVIAVHVLREDGGASWWVGADLDGDRSGYAWVAAWPETWRQIGGPGVTIRRLVPEAIFPDEDPPPGEVSYRVEAWPHNQGANGRHYSAGTVPARDVSAELRSLADRIDKEWVRSRVVFGR